MIVQKVSPSLIEVDLIQSVIQMTKNHFNNLAFNHSNGHIASVTYPYFGDVISFYCFILTTFLMV